MLPSCAVLFGLDLYFKTYMCVFSSTAFHMLPGGPKVRVICDSPTALEWARTLHPPLSVNYHFLPVRWISIKSL